MSVNQLWSGLKIGKDRVPYKCFLKLFAVWSPEEKKLRLGRIVYAVNGGPDNPKRGYSAKLQFAVCLLKPFDFHKDTSEWWLTFLGIKLHHTKSYGGWCV